MTKGVQDLPVPTKELLKNWMQTIKDQEQAITHNHRNAQESMTLTPVVNIADTEQGIAAQVHCPTIDRDCPPTDVSHKTDADQLLSAEDVIEKIRKECELNEKQWVAYRIVA